ncbi:MAG: hypothetical protein ACO39Y_11895, partial [Ilumatobacteraceae bacterium]
ELPPVVDFRFSVDVLDDGIVVIVVVVVEVEVELDETKVDVVDEVLVEVRIVVVVAEQNGADQLIVVVVVKNAAVVELAGTVVVETTGSSSASPTQRMMWLIDLSPNVPPLKPPGSEMPFLLTSANTPEPGSGL